MDRDIPENYVKNVQHARDDVQNLSIVCNVKFIKLGS